MNNNTQIIITGAGYSGLIMALALAHFSIPSTIIEHKKCQGSFLQDPKTTSITASSQQFLDQINIWQKLAPLAGEVKDIYILDNKKPNILHLQNNAIGKFGFMIPNGDLKSSLLRIAKKNKLITILDETSYELLNCNDDGLVQIKLHNDKILTTELLIVAEGKNSTILAKYFPYAVNKDYKQTAFIFNVEHQKSHEGCAVEHFLPTGPFAILPLVSQNHSAVVWSVESELAIAYQTLSTEEFTFQVQKLFGEFLGKINIITPISAFNLSAQLREKYFHNNIVLIADTAHCVHPLAGQGLNQGIKDIAALADLLSKSYDLGLTPNAAMLNKYEKIRKADNFKMFLATDFLDKVFSNNSRLMSIVRSAGFWTINNCQYLKRKIISYGVE